VIVYRPRSLAVFEAMDRVFELEIQKLAKFLIEDSTVVM
jgi:hypothetical protein